MRQRILVALLFSLRCLAQAQGSKGAVLVVTANARDYLLGAGGALAGMIDEGRPVYVLQFGNGEKDSIGLGPAETRDASTLEAERAAKSLGVREVLNLGHKSGELGYVSSSEMRNQVMAMMRFYKPEIMFFPDWYIHYVEDWDIYRVGHMAEEAPYGGGSYFLQELTYMGYEGFAAREYYFYSPSRPYRAGEGGEGNAQMRNIDITPMLGRKLRAILELKTSNRRYALETRQRLEKAGRASPLLREIGEESAAELVRAYVEELAETVGKKRGFRYGEEFNYLGRTGAIPEHILERAKPVP